MLGPNEKDLEKARSVCKLAVRTFDLIGSVALRLINTRGPLKTISKILITYNFAGRISNNETGH